MRGLPAPWPALEPIKRRPSAVAAHPLERDRQHRAIRRHRALRREQPAAAADRRKLRLFNADTAKTGVCPLSFAWRAGLGGEGAGCSGGATATRILLVMNEAFGSWKKLPFDLQNSRKPACFTVDAEPAAQLA